MPRKPIAIRLGCALAAFALAWPAAALAFDAPSYSPFTSATIDRTIHGDVREVDLSRLTPNLGRADAFFGIDSESTATQRYLTSGLQWASSRADAPLVRASALRTESDGAALRGGQTLMRVENRLDLGDRWYLPDLATEIAQTTNQGADGMPVVGRAARMGFTQGVGAGEVMLGYFQADPQFDALGSAIVAGDRGLELQMQQRLGDEWRLEHDVRLHQPSALRSETAIAQSLVLSRRSHLTDLGDPWQLRAAIGAPIDARAGGHTPLALEIASQTLGWRDWRIDSSLGWYDASMDAPLSLPVDGALWRLSGRRTLSLAGLRAQLAPSFALGESRYQRGLSASRTGFDLGFTQISEHLDLSMSYLSAGWAAPANRGGDLQMMLKFRRSTGAILPDLSAAAQALRLPWLRRP